MRADVDYLADMLEAGRQIGAYVAGQSVNTFRSYAMRRDAVLYQLAIIGEAAGRLSKPLRDSHPGVPWKSIVGMRNIVIHQYGGVDVDIAWETATVQVPSLMAALRQMLPRPGAPPTP